MQPKLKHKSIKIKYVAAAAVIAAAVFGVVWHDAVLQIKQKLDLTPSYTEAQAYRLAVCCPEIGSGGCTLIHTDEANILIDCGRERAQSNVCNMLDDLGITVIDLAVLTHPDSDHIGNFEEVSQKYTIGQFVTCEYSHLNGGNNYCSLENALQAKNVPISFVSAGDRFMIGDLTLDVIAPTKMYESSNDNSVAIRLTYGEFNALFMGDVSKKAEKDILAGGSDVSADLLYVPHHGSAGSSCEEFLKAAMPKYAVISAQESRYHPASQTISRLRDIGCEIYRTDISGDIYVCTNGTDDSINIITSY